MMYVLAHFALNRKPAEQCRVQDGHHLEGQGLVGRVTGPKATNDVIKVLHPHSRC